MKPPYLETAPSLGLAYCPLAGQEVSLAQAQAAVPFKIKLPTSLGQFTVMKFEEELNATTIVFSSEKPADDADFFDIMQTDAIVLFELPNTMTLKDSKQNTLDAISSTRNDVGGGLQPVEINGYFGCAGGNIYHTVTWYTETTYYQLATSLKLPLPQLVEIANSIPLE